MNLRQIGVRYHHVKDLVRLKYIKFVYCRTNYNCADSTTKPNGPMQHKFLTKFLTRGGGSVEQHLEMFSVFNKSIVKACLLGNWQAIKHIAQNSVLKLLGVQQEDKRD